jgi:hypothetical protein
MRIAAIAIAAALALVGCGGSGGGDRTTTEQGAAGKGTTGPGGSSAQGGNTDGQLPPGAVGPVDTSEETAEGPAATEASPGQAPRGPSTSGELPEADRSAAAAVVAAYIRGIDRHDAARVCSLLAPGSLDPGDLPVRAGGCRGSLHASIGARPRNGGPAWRRSVIASTKVERLSDTRARVSATVVHHFSDRKYVSVEDDVIYEERLGGRWRLAKPSGTLYRAVGYPQPPLRAFTPPPAW